MTERGAEREPFGDTRRVVLVTGLSGAGRTTCLKTLEDRGFEAVDNLPLSLLPALLAPFAGTGRTGSTERLAVGVDTRTRDFDAETLLRSLDDFRSRDMAVSIVFLDCDSDVLIRRFTETRRRHPLATDRPVADGIRTERQLLEPLKERADLVIDSSHLSLPDFRLVLAGGLGIGTAETLTVTVTSFGFRNGLPREADMVFDVRFLANPHYDDALRPLDGRDAAVADFVRRDPGFEDFFERLTGFLGPLVPRYADEGKSYLTVAIGCTGGRHRSVFVAEGLAQWLRKTGHVVTLRHRDLERVAEA